MVEWIIPAGVGFILGCIFFAYVLGSLDTYDNR